MCDLTGVIAVGMLWRKITLCNTYDNTVIVHLFIECECNYQFAKWRNFCYCSNRVCNL